MKKIGIQAVILSAMATQPVLAVRETTTSTINYLAIILFLIFVLMTLVITYVAAKHTHTRKEFYSAGNKITGWQNGIAMAGDFMSAASFLGISALVYTSGFDGLIYSLGFLVGWPIMMFLIAEPLRNLGRYTFADAASYRLKQTPIRCLSAIGSLLVIVLYLVAQMVGAGELIQLIFGINYYLALIIIGCLMVIYVLFGGMVATTWVQITKALLLLAGSSFMALMVLKTSGFSLNQLFTEAILIHPSKSAIMQPGELIKGPISALSLGLALMFGTAGLPHILMRFFTVSNAQEARKSVFWATGLMGYFYLLTFIIGFGAIVLLQGQPAFNDGNGHLIGGANMAAIHLANAIGGSTLLGLISATAFATILAVVAGLTLAGASSVSHDLYTNVICKGKVNEQKEIKISKITVLCLGIIGIFLGVIFKDQNIAYMVGLAFSIAASCNFPVLLLSLYWRNLTTRGATIGGALGLGSAVLLMIPAPTIWVQVLGHEQALFPYDYPALFSMPLSFAAIWFFSITDRSPQAILDRQNFEKQRLQALTGIQLNHSED